MHINWKVRIKNPVFWKSVVIAVIAPILAYFGLNFSELTTWGAVGKLFADAAKNPAIVISVICSLWNAVIDPTTKTFSDSNEVMKYTEPLD